MRKQENKQFTIISIVIYFNLAKNIYDQIIKQETNIVNKYGFKSDQYVTSLMNLIKNSK